MAFTAAGDCSTSAVDSQLQSSVESANIDHSPVLHC